MEDDLDAIANGLARSPRQWLGKFYFGEDGASGSDPHGLRQLVDDRIVEIDAREVNSLPVGEGRGRRARRGPGWAGMGPTCRRATCARQHPRRHAPGRADRRAGAGAAQQDQRRAAARPAPGDCSEPILVRSGRYGPYVTTQPLDGGEIKTASLFKDMKPSPTLTLDDAVRLLSLPRTLGVDAANDNEPRSPRRTAEVRAVREAAAPSHGRWSLRTALFTVTLEEALALLAQPKTARAAAPPPRRCARSVPTRPAGSRWWSAKGRFGPYVTDGETNASLRKGDSIEELTVDRAAELLAERRARGPVHAEEAGPGQACAGQEDRSLPSGRTKTDQEVGGQEDDEADRREADAQGRQLAQRPAGHGQRQGPDGG